EQHQVRHFRAEAFQRLLAIAGFDYLIMMAAQGRTHNAADLRIVIHYQNLAGAHETSSPLWRGSEKLKTEPWPGSLVTQSLPPCASTIPFAIASPIPVPCV